ncbi:MAG: hypothetical protein IJ731_03810 [Eubacterium sp.]|nr:hypothetical protein [Eubacterium sp.]
MMKKLKQSIAIIMALTMAIPAVLAAPFSASAAEVTVNFKTADGSAVIET